MSVDQARRKRISLSRGRVATGVLQKPQKGAITWPTRKTPLPASAKVPIRELCTTPSPRARVRVVRPTGILKESLLDLPGARARVREESADFTAWRVKTFGGDFDPVCETVEDAVAEFSDRQPARDRSLWLKIANKIGYEAFRELYLEQVSIMRECKLRNPSAAFQNRLNRYTNHSPACTAQGSGRSPVRSSEKGGVA